jgi:cell division protease FtsH
MQRMMKYQVTRIEMEPRRTYHLSQKYHEMLLKRLNTKNLTIQNNAILGTDEEYNEIYNKMQEKMRNNSEMYNDNNNNNNNDNNNNNNQYKNPRVIIQVPAKSSANFLNALGLQIQNNQIPSNNDDDDDYFPKRKGVQIRNTKSKNFEVIKDFPITFKDVGGYESVKDELRQCVDILKDYKKYQKYNVRIPRGLVLEGPPGTGKTLIAKSLAGEAGCSFISVAGSDFQEKYVGVGSTRVKELFGLAKENIPCIIFIDEIDAVGRKRSSDGESSSNERDNTLNALLVELDGFKNNTGVFIVGATNRIDLLDSALMRPGRIDKKIYIGLPDNTTRKAIIDIHIEGKPCDSTIILSDLVEITDGLSGAQIENLLNEAMLYALRLNKTEFSYTEFDMMMNKMIAGWQPSDHQFTDDLIDRIVIHEMGHAVVGILSKHHSKMSKVVINLSSPKSPGYTIFEHSKSSIYIREALFEHLMILLAGRIAEEVFYDVSVTTGAINDFEEALKLAEKMIMYYGMGKNMIYPTTSEKYKEMVDTEVVELINEAYKVSELIIEHCKDLIIETSIILKRDKLLKAETLYEIIHSKYKYILDD